MDKPYITLTEAEADELDWFLGIWGDTFVENAKHDSPETVDAFEKTRKSIFAKIKAKRNQGSAASDHA